MCDEWDDNADNAAWGGQNHGGDQPRVFSNTNRQQSNWRNQSDNGQRSYNRNSDRGDRRGGGGGGGGFNRGPPRQNNDGDATLIKIPSKMVGRVIGRGGSKINDLQFESGARINVTKDTDGDQTIVKIVGDDDAVNKAKSLIEELTVEREPREQRSFYPDNNSHQPRNMY